MTRLVSAIAGILSPGSTVSAPSLLRAGLELLGWAEMTLISFWASHFLQAQWGLNSVPFSTDAQKCELICQSADTGDVVFMNQVVHDGTRCSYRDPYSVCARGECVVGAPLGHLPFACSWGLEGCADGFLLPKIGVVTTATLGHPLACNIAWAAGKESLLPAPFKG